jgi:3-dehydroquinate dehydratase-2
MMKDAKKILVIHGPNLDLLGKRETGIYGKITLADIDRELKKIAESNGIEISFLQSSHEGEIVERIGKSKDSLAGILINPAAYTHTSIAIRDALSAVDIPAVEVHLSNIYSREDFRHISLIAPVCAGQISGFGINSYRLGLMALIEQIKK